MSAACGALMLALHTPGPSSANEPAAKAAEAEPTLLGRGWGAEHLIVMTKELEPTRNAFAQLGFTATAPNSVSKVLFHSVIAFQDGTYLELTQFVVDPKTAQKHASTGHTGFLSRYAEFVRKREGAKHIGIAVKPASETTRFLRARGFEVTEPIGDTTQWDIGQSPTPEWYAVDFTKPKGLTESISFLEYAHADEMLAEQKANEEKGLRLRSEEHRNTAIGLSEVWLVVRNLEAQAKVMESIGFTRGGVVEKPHLGAEGVRFDTGRASILLLAPTKVPKSLAGTWLKKNGEGIMGARVKVEDIASALIMLRERFPKDMVVIATRGEKGGRGFVVDGKFAGGVFLEFWAGE